MIRQARSPGSRLASSTGRGTRGGLPGPGSAQLTAIREPVREIGRVAAELVIEAINNPKLQPQERLVDSAELVVRPSTVGMADGTR